MIAVVNKCEKLFIVYVFPSSFSAHYGELFVWCPWIQDRCYDGNICLVYVIGKNICLSMRLFLLQNYLSCYGNSVKHLIL